MAAVRRPGSRAGPIHALLTARDGTLWIGADTGLASWKAGKLTQYPELAGYEVSALLEDRERTVWAGSSGYPPGGSALFELVAPPAPRTAAAAAASARTGRAISGRSTERTLEMEAGRP